MVDKVDQAVIVQVTGPAEHGTAHVTAEGAGVCVGQHVCPQVGGLTEALATCVTLVQVVLPTHTGNEQCHIVRK